MTLLLVLPLLIPLTVAALSLLTWRRLFVQRALAVLGAVALLGVSAALLGWVWQEGVQAEQLGDWPAPFGITLVADTFSAVMVVLAATMGLLVTVYSLERVDRRRETFGYYPLLQVLLMGVCGAFLTGDIFNLFVWFEVMLIASFVLLALGGERPQLEGAIKYVTLNLVSSALFLAAVGLLYGTAGTLNMADLAVKLRDIEDPGLITTIAMLFLVAFGIKAAAFPLFFWLPASYHTPPVPVAAIFAGLLTKVGVYALIRVFTLLFTQDVAYTHNLILAGAGLTMVTGVLGAVAQNEMRRLLSFHIVSQIGYLLMGLGLYTTASLAAAVFFMIHIVFAKSALFLVSGLVHRLRGTYELKELGGLYRAEPAVSMLFLLPALSLAGLPPFSGFFGKLALIRAGLDAEQYAIVATALAVSLLTLFSMMKIWAGAFWKDLPGGLQRPGVAPLVWRTRSGLLLGVPSATLAALALAIGLAAGPLFAISERAGEELHEPSGYIEAVLGGEQ
jgi:multicomponent Na+:H+ antiporter subunit D